MSGFAGLPMDSPDEAMLRQSYFRLRTPKRNASDSPLARLPISSVPALALSPLLSCGALRLDGPTHVRFTQDDCPFVLNRPFLVHEQRTFLEKQATFLGIRPLESAGDLKFDTSVESLNKGNAGGEGMKGKQLKGGNIVQE